MNYILKAKHWQLFLLFLLPQLFSQMVSGSFGYYLGLFSKLLNTSILLVWLWAISVNFKKESNSKIGMFKISLCLCALYLIYASLVNVSFNVSEIDKEWIVREWMRFTPHLLFIIGILYCVGFSARTLKSLELNRAVSLGDYFVDVILILLFPLGVWFLQPRVNGLIKNY